MRRAEGREAVSTSEMRAVVLGVHVLDTLVLPVESIPDGQDGQLVDQIRQSPAGTAAATALTLAKLGAHVRSVGMVGTDSIGDLLVELLRGHGVDTSLVRRREDVQTSASVLPIRPDGSRPAFHVIGANAFVGEHVPWEAIADATHVHVGGPEFYGPDLAAEILAFARRHGAITSADCLAPGAPETLPSIEKALPYVDYLLPNDAQVLGWTGATELIAGCRSLIERGVGCVVATAGLEASVAMRSDGTHAAIPSFGVDVVDTSGCGDAFSAGFLRGLSLGLSVFDSAVLATATAAQVARGLGSDFGEFDLDSVRSFAATAPTHPERQTP
jgi:sugar/nucleoside kinase (ribokinase family)